MSPGENPKDKSILGSKNKQVESYLDDLAFAICINGEPIEKYKKIVSKQYGVDAYANMEKFAQALQQQVQVGQFTKTSLLSLKYIGKNAGMSENAIDVIVEHFNDKMKEAQQKKEEDECWKKCSGNDNSALLEYLRIYPNGRYAKQAQAKFKEEEAKREDTTFWKRCNQNDKRQLSEYLRKYPKGLYAPKAISLIADLERMEKAECSTSATHCETTGISWLNSLMELMLQRLRSR